MLQLLIFILGIFITIFFVIGTHESAHFIAARMLGVKVLRFSIGFGKRLFHWYDRKGTEYVIALIPLGGYVKMLDENEGEVSASELAYAYNRQPFYKKFIIVLAGPLANLFCAFVLYWIIFVVGFTTIKPTIGQIKPNSIAAQAGMQVNQTIVSVDDQATLTWPSIIMRIVLHAGSQDQLIMQTTSNNARALNSYSLDLDDWRLDDLNPDPLLSLGIIPAQPNIPLIIGVINEDSPALKANLKIGDKILAIDNRAVKDWEGVINFVSKHPSTQAIFLVERNNQQLSIPVQLDYKRSFIFKKYGYLGVGPAVFKWPETLLQKIKYDPVSAISHAWQQIVDFTYFNLVLFGKMITGKLSLQSLGGPITIFETAGQALNYGFIAFIGFLAFLSISIGVINLLPIPGLDGGHLFFQLIELIIRRPIPDRILILFYQLGFIFIFILLFQALMNDILRL